MDGARELILALRDRGHRTVLASSAKADEVEHYVELLDAREIVVGWTTSADVENTKPAPDLVHAALERVGADDGETAVMVGDTPWDIKAAEKAGVPTLAVITGGFSEQELRDAGAADVFESVGELESRLDDSRSAGDDQRAGASDDKRAGVSDDQHAEASVTARGVS